MKCVQMIELNAIVFCLRETYYIIISVLVLSVLGSTDATSWVQVVDTRRRPCRFSTNKIFCNCLKVLVIGHFRIRTPQCL